MSQFQHNEERVTPLEVTADDAKEGDVLHCPESGGTFIKIGSCLVPAKSTDTHTLNISHVLRWILRDATTDELDAIMELVHYMDKETTG